MRIRHLYRKAAIYGVILAVSILLIAWLRYTGVEWETIAISFAAIILSVTVACLLFNRLELWLLRAEVVDKVSDPRLFHIVEGLCKNNGLRAPHLAVIDDTISDVFVGGATRNDSYIFVTSGLLTAFNDEELKTILAHELEFIDEMGSFIYNIVTMAFSLPLKASRSAVSGRPRGSLVLKDSVARDEYGSHMVIAKANVSDVPAAVRLLIAHGMYEYVYIHDLVGLARERSPLFLIAYYDGNLAGFVTGEIDHGPFRRRAHITKIISDGSYRRKGIGSHLLQAFIDMAKRSGYWDCHIEVRMNNRNAISLYEKFDFTIEDTIPKYYPDGTDCLIMLKILAKKG